MYQVDLVDKDGKHIRPNLHILVAKYFVFNPDLENNVTVNHIDGDRSNNKASNLEWVSYSENLQHAYDVLNRPVNRNTVKRRPCKSKNKHNGEIVLYSSIAEASRNTNISETQIRRIISKECINGDYEFEYLPLDK